MHPRVRDFSETARDRYGLEIDPHEFDEGTKTAEDAADAVGCDVAQIASSLVFLVDGEPVVVVTSGANRVSEDRLADYFDADEVRMLIRTRSGTRPAGASAVSPRSVTTGSSGW